MAEATAVRLRFYIGGQNKIIRPTFYLATSPGAASAPVPLAELGDLAEDTRAAAGTAGLLANFCADVRLLGVEAQNVEWEDATPTNPAPHLKPTTITFDSTGAVIIGTAAGDSDPPQSSVLVSFKTPTPGRRYRGRMYLPPAPEGSVQSAGNMPDATADAIESDIEDVITNAIASPTATPDLVVFSRVGDFTTAVLDTPTLRAGIKVRRYVATQRRRRVSST